MTAFLQQIELAPTSTFQRWWQSAGEWVEAANQRRSGESGVQLLRPRNPAAPLLYCKRQTGHLYRSLTHPLGRPTIVRELHAYQAFSKLGIGVPTLVYGAARKYQGQWQALLVTEALEGFVSLEQWYGLPVSSAERQQMLGELARTLARMHLNRWQHGCCYAKHIFIRTSGQADEPQVEIVLLDLEKSRRRWRVSDAARHDMRQLRRHCAAMPADDVEFLERSHALALQRGAPWGSAYPYILHRDLARNMG